jgi:tRNA (cytidine/uridine-2'-O-)-methyltransferase
MTESTTPVAPLLHVVLHQPDIPQNTGNIGRTCVAVGAKLWLIRPLGFVLDERHLRRAGMDYWEHLDYEVVENWADFRNRCPSGRVWLIENPAAQLLWEATFSPGDVLVFGSETQGLPPSLIDEYRSSTVQLPMRPAVRSLNLASTVNTAVYEAVRQFGGLG